MKSKIYEQRKMKMYKKKIKDIKDKEIIFLKNYDIDKLLKQNKSFNYAWQKICEIPSENDKDKILIARLKKLCPKNIKCR